MLIHYHQMFRFYLLVCLLCLSFLHLAVVVPRTTEQARLQWSLTRTSLLNVFCSLSGLSIFVVRLHSFYTLNLAPNYFLLLSASRICLPSFMKYCLDAQAWFRLNSRANHAQFRDDHLWISYLFHLSASVYAFFAWFLWALLGWFIALSFLFAIE